MKRAFDDVYLGTLARACVTWVKCVYCHEVSLTKYLSLPLFLFPLFGRKDSTRSLDEATGIGGVKSAV